MTPMTPTETIDALNAEAWEKHSSNPARAVELAAEAERLARQAEGYPRGLGWSLLTSGVCALNSGDLTKAGERLVAALDLLAGCDQRDGEAYALNNVGNLHVANGENALALEHYHASRSIWQEIGHRRGEAEALHNIGLAHQSLGEYPQALEQYRASLAIWQEIGDRRSEARALVNLGNVFYPLGEYTQALEHFQASLRIFRELGDRSGEALALNGIGNVFYPHGEYPQAMEHFQASLRIFHELGHRSWEAAALGNIGSIYQSLGQYPQALEHLQASRSISQEIGNRRGEAVALINIGNLHSSLGEFLQALEPYQASLGICQEIGDRRGEAHAQRSIGNIYSSLGEYAQALEQYRASLSIFREIGDRVGEAVALIGIASVHTVQGEFPAALGELEAAAEIARQTSERNVLCEALQGLGRTYAAMEQPRESIASLEAAIALAVELGARSLEIGARELLWKQHRIMGNLSAALENLLRYGELKEELLGEETRRTIRNREAALQIEIARKEVESERLRNVELKQAFDELKATQSLLVQAEKMASLGHLVAGIAHEINNPINFVSAGVRPAMRNIAHIREVLAELAARLPADQSEEVLREAEIEETFEELDQLMTGIASGASRTAEIVAGLRSFSRLDEHELKQVDLHEGLDAALTLLSGRMSEGIALEREYGDLPPVECYPGEINQVFMNILVNAVMAIDGVGSVKVRSSVAGGSVMIEITDSGAGMTPEVQARVFEPFFTTRDVGQGKGLGLSIAWGIIRKHGGSIQVSSTPGEGSSFTIVLPVRFAGE
jgi:two-component system, NtrC family, sensor kinase